MFCPKKWLSASVFHTVFLCMTLSQPLAFLCVAVLVAFFTKTL